MLYPTAAVVRLTRTLSDDGPFPSVTLCQSCLDEVHQRDDWETYLFGEDVPNASLSIEVDILQYL